MSRELTWEHQLGNALTSENGQGLEAPSLSGSICDALDHDSEREDQRKRFGWSDKL